MTDITNLTESLSRARRTKAWSQQELANKLNMRQSQISDIEAGKRDLRLSTLVDVARAVGLEIVLVPRPFLPAVSHVLKPSGSAQNDNQQSMYECWNEE